MHRSRLSLAWITTVIVLMTALLGGGYAARVSAAARASASTRSVFPITLPDGSRHTLQVPAGLQVTLFATGLSSARFLALGPHGVLFVGGTGGTVSAVVPGTSGHQAARVVTLLRGLDVPHGVVYHNGLLYVGEQHQVSTWRYDAARVRVYGQRVIVPNLPAGSGHATRTVVFGPDGVLYVSIGSSCNVCVESDPRRAAIMRYRADGSHGQLYARGLRNAVGLAWQPGTGLLWATVNGRDNLGDTIPPDLLTIVRYGNNLGWPYCWGNRQPDPTVPPPAGYCARITLPSVNLPAHSAPLGLAFATGHLLPSRYRGGLFVAYHGSWNRSVPTGYKLVYVPVQGTHAGPPQDIVRGWRLAGASGAWGRPVGVLVAPDGSLLISDDTAGVLYRLAPTGR
jgi:glucose/arabinose dehydrogenase